MLLSQIGLILNIIGAIMTTTSFGDPPSTAYQIDSKGRKTNLAAFLHPLRLKFGMIFLIVGFVFMLIDTL